MDETQVPNEPENIITEVKHRRGRPRKSPKTDDLLPLTLGMVLRQARQKQHLKLPSVAKKLKIKEIYLNALEEGNYYLFPGKVYGIGFLRSYATSLGLDADELVARFHRETQGLEEEVLDVPFTPDKDILPSLRTAVKALILLFVLYLVWNLFKIMTYTPMPEPVAETPITVEPVSVVEPVTETPKVTEPVAIVTPKTITPEPKQERKVPERVPVVYGLKKTARVSFVATAKTWIEIRDTEADSILLSQNLDVGDRYNPDEDAEGMVLKTTNAGGLDVYVDGRKIGPLGRKGQTKAGIQMDADSLMKE